MNLHMSTVTKNKLAVALDVVEMLEYILDSAVLASSKESNNPNRQKLLSSNLPIPGIRRSVSQVRSLLSEVLEDEIDVLMPLEEKPNEGEFHLRHENNEQINESRSSEVDQNFLRNTLKEELSRQDKSIPDRMIHGALIKDDTFRHAVNPKPERTSHLDKGNYNLQNEKQAVYEGASSRSGLAGRIKPVPDEVRGRVRELVEMIEEEDLKREAYDESRL